MGTINSITILGRLGKDPELRFTNSGTSVCEFSVATDRGARNDDKVTDWHKVIAWEKQGEVASKFLKKGSEVCVQGEVRYGKFTGKDGQERFTTEVKAHRITLIGKPAGGGGGGGGQQSSTTGGPAEESQDAPFF
tara:strand:+ start:9 stop:413 length:405 start_codon:yes stop_codon:yes gene_type:complete